MTRYRDGEGSRAKKMPKPKKAGVLKSRGKRKIPPTKVHNY